MLIPTQEELSRGRRNTIPAGRCDETQKKAFFKWLNNKNQGKFRRVNEYVDLRDGLALITLLQGLTGKSAGPCKSPCTDQFQEMAHLNMAFDFMKGEGLKLVGIGAEDVHKGNGTLILGMMWQLILKYQVVTPQEVAAAPPVAGMPPAPAAAPPQENQVRKNLITWVNTVVSRYPHVAPITDFSTSFKDGKVICALTEALQPGLIDTSRLSNPLIDLNHAMQTAESLFGIPRVLDGSDVVNNTGDELSVIMYVSYFRHELLRRQQQPPQLQKQLSVDALAQQMGGMQIQQQQAPPQQPPLQQQGYNAQFPAQPPQQFPMPGQFPGQQGMPPYGVPPGYAGGYGGPPPQQNLATMNQEQKHQALQNIIAQHEITNFHAQELWALQNFDIVFLCDDSGSMRAKIQTGNQYGRPKSRWDELREIVTMVVEVAHVFDADGLDVYFLNRPPLRNIFAAQAIQPAFAAPPEGFTPLRDALQQLLTEHVVRGKTKPLLIMIATDGQPTDRNGNGDLQGFRAEVQRAVRITSREVRFQFLACSDNEADVGWLNEMDQQVQHVDVTDDYQSERQEVLKAGRFPNFTKGDYVCKALLGGISDQYDSMDEHNQPVTAPYGRGYSGGQSQGQPQWGGGGGYGAASGPGGGYPGAPGGGYPVAPMAQAYAQGAPYSQYGAPPVQKNYGNQWAR